MCQLITIEAVKSSFAGGMTCRYFRAADEVQIVRDLTSRGSPRIRDRGEIIEPHARRVGEHLGLAPGIGDRVASRLVHGDMLIRDVEGGRAHLEEPGGGKLADDGVQTDRSLRA